TRHRHSFPTRRSSDLKQGNLAFSIFQDIMGGQHQFKLGVDYQDLKSVSDFHYPQNKVFYVADFDPKNRANPVFTAGDIRQDFIRSEEHTSELQSLTNL